MSHQTKAQRQEILQEALDQEARLFISFAKQAIKTVEDGFVPLNSVESLNRIVTRMAEYRARLNELTKKG